VRGFERVLVPVDLSSGSSRLLETAERLLADGGKILLLHVVDFVPSVVEGAFGGYARAKDLRSTHEEAKQRLLEMRRAHAALPVETSVLEADPDDGILEAAARFRADAIVLGAHADRRIGPFVLGSVAQKVLRRAPCPVVVVPARSREA
jgi:nucleotide-binding universal stress UspA family protein